jgi:tetratricopeptide (TPR) repeat protein
MTRAFHSLALTAAFIGILVTVSGCTKNPAVQKRAHFDRAEQYMADAKYAEAVIEYRNALQIDPNDAQANLRLGLAYLSQQPLAYAQPAFAALSKAVELDPSLLEAQLKLGELLALNRQFDAAKAKAQLVLAQNPQDLEALLLLAKSELGEGHGDAAREAVATAKAAHPADPRPWLRTGRFRRPPRSTARPSAP